MTNQVAGDVSLQYMINGSRAVLTNPSVATFEEYERNNLNWALIYVALGALIAGILGAIGFAVNPPVVNVPADLPPELAQAFQQSANQSPIGLAINNLVSALIGFIIYTAIVFGLGRLFKGTGSFGELAFDLSLPYTPLAVLVALVNVFSIGVLSFLTGLVAFAAGLYQIYLSYLAIQSGMNLPKDKALYVMLIMLGVVLLFVCGIAAIVGVGIAALSGAGQ